VVKSAKDGSPRATATGITSTVQLPPGDYVVTLNVVDNTGASSTAGAHHAKDLDEHQQLLSVH